MIGPKTVRQLEKMKIRLRFTWKREPRNKVQRPLEVMRPLYGPPTASQAQAHLWVVEFLEVCSGQLTISIPRYKMGQRNHSLKP
jgi:hypothetical protein